MNVVLLMSLRSMINAHLLDVALSRLLLLMVGRLDRSSET